MTFSKTLILASIMLVAGGAPVLAADFGGIKDMGGGVAVPVPAPAPVPTFDADSDWYIGLAIGANISQSATINDTDTDYLGDSSPGVWARDSSDIGASPIFGLTFGRYITPSLRAEIAIDYSPDAQISNSNKLGYVVTNSAPRFSGGIASIDTNAYSVTRTDTVKLARTTGLFNLLYDIPTGTRFTPYIGGGFGFTWRSLRRSYSESATCIGAVNSDTGPYTPGGSCSGNPTLPASTSTVSGSSSKQQLDFAAAVQAGVAYNITDQIIWDNGWQMLWEGNSIASVAPSASGDNRIVYKDSVLQQFRSGIRIKFD
jgi:opacity protein-like surface antigen